MPKSLTNHSSTHPPTHPSTHLLKTQGSRRGNQIVHIKIEMPKSLTAKQKEIMQSFQEEEDKVSSTKEKRRRKRRRRRRRNARTEAHLPTDLFTLCS